MGWARGLMVVFVVALVAACGDDNDSTVDAASAADAARSVDADQTMPDADPGAPDAVSNVDADPAMRDAMPGAADAMAGAPDAMAGAPDAMPGAPDAMPGAPDAMPPDATPAAPDAAPPGPDAAPPPICDPAPTGADPDAVAVLMETNAIRLAMGIGCQSQHVTLNTASKLHCDYYAANSGACIASAHSEVMGCNLFVAVNFWERMAAAGYTGTARFETMAFGGAGLNAVQQWLNSVWHKEPLLSPWMGDQGYGRATGCDTMDFGVGTISVSDVIASYPYDGQIDVPRSFSGNEGPPPPAPPDGFPSGSPIHLFIQNATITTHTLRVSGTVLDLPHTWLTPADSPFLANAFAMYADDPMAATTTYEVHIIGTHNGSPLDITFEFTTN